VSTSSEPDAATTRVSGLRLTYALFGGILAWMAHLIAMAALNGWVCRTGRLWPMHAVTAATLVATLHVLWVSRQVSRDPTPDPGIRAAHFLGSAAIVINLFNAVLIVAEWVPVLVVHPCSTG